jgi:hypothetical protein
VIELSCPLCQSTVLAPNARRHTRLHCRKCHTPLHIDKAGRVAIGEPPDVEQDLQELKQTLRDFRSRIPIRPIAAAVLAVFIIGTAARYVLGSSSGPAEAAKEAAQALVENDAGTIRSLAAPGTSDAAARWFREARQQLDRQREHWYGKEEVIDVHVAGEDPAQKKAVVGVSIRPGFGSARDVSLADPAAATASAASPLEVQTVWIQQWWSGWKLDGRETAARQQARP